MDNIKNRSVEEVAAELKREYMREWNAKNKSKNADYQKRYWERKAVAELERLEG